MAEVLAKKKEEVLRRDFSVVWIHTLLIPSYTLDLRAIQGHCGGKHIDFTLQDNVLLPSDFAEHIFHVGSSHDLHSIIQSGLIPGGKHVKNGRHAVFSTAVNSMVIDHARERGYDVTKPRNAVYKHNWKIHQNTGYWCNLRTVESEGLQFYQTR